MNEKCKDIKERYEKEGWLDEGEIVKELFRAQIVDTMVSANPKFRQWGLSLDELFELMNEYTTPYFGLYKGTIEQFGRLYPHSLRVDPFQYGLETGYFKGPRESIWEPIDQAVKETIEKEEDTLVFGGIEQYLGSLEDFLRLAKAKHILLHTKEEKVKDILKKVYPLLTVLGPTEEITAQGTVIAVAVDPKEWQKFEGAIKKDRSSYIVVPEKDWSWEGQEGILPVEVRLYTIGEAVYYSYAYGKKEGAVVLHCQGAKEGRHRTLPHFSKSFDIRMNVFRENPIVAPYIEDGQLTPLVTIGTEAHIFRGTAVEQEAGTGDVLCLQGCHITVDGLWMDGISTSTVIDEGQLLEEGDLLLTKQGRYVHTAVYGAQALAAVPAEDVWVIRPYEKGLGDYIKIVLDSEPGRAMLHEVLEMGITKDGLARICLPMIDKAKARQLGEEERARALRMHRKIRQARQEYEDGMYEGQAQIWEKKDGSL